MNIFFRKKGRPLFFIILFLMLLFSIGSASAADLEVGPSGYTYSTINQALAAAQAGDTINVHDNSGTPYTYQENIEINKANISLVSKGNVTLTPSGSKRGLLINSSGNGSKITGFNIIAEAWTDDGTGNLPVGVSLYDCKNCIISNNIVKGFFWGIISGKNNVINNNTIYNNSYGIELEGSNITYNTIYNCSMGISDHGSGEANLIYKNIIYDCEEGIYLVWCDFTLIEGNQIIDCTTGWGDYSAHITFHNNTISNCNYGIAMNANNNVISGNILDHNQVGMDITVGNDNLITFNIIQYSSHGIQIYGSSRNNITHNNITHNMVGILIDEYMDTSTLIAANDNKVLSNDLSYNSDGIVFGSIFSEASGNEVHYNRIVANTAWGLVNYSDEVVNATWNWWGSNADPSSKIYGTTIGGVITNVIYRPWIILTGTAWPNTINAGASSEITAYLTTGSDGLPVMGGWVPDEITVLFTTSKGSIASPKYTNLGLADSWLVTQLSTLGGTAVVSITVDNQTITVPVTIKGIKITDILATTYNLKKYIIRFHVLPAMVNLAGQRISTTQFLKFLGTAIWELNGPKLPAGKYRGKIGAREYLNMALIINNFIDTQGRAPNYYRSSIGKLNIYRIVNLYYQALKFYNSKKRLPSYVYGI